MARGSSPLTRGKLSDVADVRPRERLIPAHAGKTLPVSPRRSRTRAHPRSRGENMGLPIGYVSTPGSSPLTRGKRASGWHGASCGGLIPAHAGKTDQRGARGSTRAAHPRSRGENDDENTHVVPTVGSSPLTRGKRRGPSTGAQGWAAHPRSRGENLPVGGWGCCVEGSSPLTRGKHLRGLGDPPRGGLIPAHAGKTFEGGELAACSGAHPRSRGENDAASFPYSSMVGSSPLTRGKRSYTHGYLLVSGLIPAHAGKTRRRNWDTCRSRAHPRSRGENWGTQPMPTDPPGSSPLTRGKPGSFRRRRGLARLIPAHAGKTGRGCRRGRASRAHPRSRGENCAGVNSLMLSPGSSPLTRGKPDRRASWKSDPWLIPAHAGKTVGALPGVRRGRAHPRSRGENPPVRSRSTSRQGSSPLTRGKRCVAPLTAQSARLIPAHAGKTNLE